MSGSTLVLALAVAVGTVALPALAQSPLKFETGAASVSVADGDKPILEYRFGGDIFKPYVKRLFSPGGVNVLRDDVPDHLHHHGLMFAVGIDGVDFWSETKDCGRQVHREFTRAGADDRNPALGSVSETLNWTRPADGTILARERRGILVHRDQALGATLTTWVAALEPPDGRDSIKLSGSHYFGLGMRFPASMDNKGEFFYADAKAPGDIVRGDERLTAARWCGVYGDIDGKPVTVAMFDRPGNPRPALWFTMAKGFSYMSATINLWKEPLTVEAGKPLALAYGVAVWDGRVKPEEVEKLYRRWLEISPPKSEKK